MHISCSLSSTRIHMFGLHQGCLTSLSEGHRYSYVIFTETQDSLYHFIHIGNDK